MGTEVFDLTALSAAIEAPSIGIPNNDLPETKTAEPTEATEAESGKPKEAEPEAKVEEKKAEEAKATFEPTKVQKSLHEQLQAFFNEPLMSKEGRESLQTINAEVRTVFEELKEALGASKDVSEVVTSAKELQELVQASDELVYAGDPQLIENIYEDVLATNGNADAFDKLIPAFVGKLKETNPKAYYEQHVAPIYQHALESTGMVEAVRNLIKSYNAGDKASLREGIENISKHISEVGRKTEQHKAAAETAKATKQAESYKSDVQSSCDLQMKQSLGAEFGKVLRSTALGKYDRTVLVELAGHMTREINSRLDADKLLTAKLTKAYDAKDTAKVTSIYRNACDSIAKGVCDHVLKTAYPGGLEKRTAVAAQGKQEFIETKEGKALLVKSKPANLDRTAKRADVLEIAGRGYTTINGKRTLVSWRRN